MRVTLCFALTFFLAECIDVFFHRLRMFGAFTLDSILSVAFGRIADVQSGKEDRLSKAVASAFSLTHDNKGIHPLRIMAITSKHAAESIRTFLMRSVCLSSGHFPWLKRTLVYLQIQRIESDLKYIIDATIALIEERRYQEAEFKVHYLV